VMVKLPVGGSDRYRAAAMPGGTLYHNRTAAGPHRDLIIRGLADKLQQRAQGGPSRRISAHLRDLGGRVRESAGSFSNSGGVA